MKKFFKIHSKKLIAFIGVMFTCIFSILGITNLHAYTDTNGNTYYDFNQLITESKNSFVGGYTNSITNRANHLLFLTWTQDNTLSSASRNTFVYSEGGTLYYESPTVNHNLAAGNYYWFFTPTYDSITLGFWTSGASEDVSCSNINLFDLTQMFGIGNEPTTSSEAFTYLSFLGYNPVNNYIDYTLSSIKYISDYSNTNYDNLDTNYDNLQDQYNQNLSELNSVLGEVVPFSPSNISSVSVTNNSTIQTLDVTSFDYFSLVIDMSWFSSFTNQISNANQVTITITFLNPVQINTLQHYSELRNIDGDTEDIYFYLNNELKFSKTNMHNEYQVDGSYVPYTLNVDSQVSLITINMFIANMSNYDNIDSNKYTQYGTYVQGYNDAINAQQTYIDSLKTSYENQLNDLEVTKNNQIIALNSQVTSLENQTIALQRTINSLSEQIESFSSDYNLNSLMWTIAGTPFEAFKNIWDVNFFGVNLSTFILGFITTFIGLYILKKFFF